MRKNNLICPICGEPTYLVMGKNPRKDRLCGKHGRQANNEEIYQCERCGKWYPTGKRCNCKGSTMKDFVRDVLGWKDNDIDEDYDEPELTCIICGDDSNGKHFCYSCYNRYKNKTILLKVNKCKFPTYEPLYEAYENIYECEDGLVVKSKDEREIYDLLTNKGILHAYEPYLNIGEEKPIRPDFCLKNYLGIGKDVYVEYFGLKGDPEYDKKTAYKIKHYKKLRKTLICLYPKDSKNMKFALQTKVLNKSKIKENQINYYEE